MKRSREEPSCEARVRQKVDHTGLSTKRKCDQLQPDHTKRRRMENDLEDAVRKNRELQECVNALLQKVHTLEYMISLFQRNETVGSNRLITSY